MLRSTWLRRRLPAWIGAIDGCGDTGAVCRLAERVAREIEEAAGYPDLDAFGLMDTEMLEIVDLLFEGACRPECREADAVVSHAARWDSVSFLGKTIAADIFVLRSDGRGCNASGCMTGILAAVDQRVLLLAAERGAAYEDLLDVMLRDPARPLAVWGSSEEADTWAAPLPFDVASRDAPSHEGMRESGALCNFLVEDTATHNELFSCALEGGDPFECFASKGVSPPAIAFARQIEATPRSPGVATSLRVPGRLGLIEILYPHHAGGADS